MTTILLSLKFLGVLSSAIFSILGTVHKFRNDDGRLTKWGRASITGTIVSVLVAFSAQLLENYLQGRSALASTQRLERVVSELNRTIQPIDTVSAWIEIKVPMDDPLLAHYKASLEKQMHLNPNLPIPVHRNESPEYFVLNVYEVELAFFKNPIEPTTFRPFRHGFPPNPDLRVGLRNTGTDLDLRKSSESGEFSLIGVLDSKKQAWEK